jgi:membrane protease YdiL (CAAX protease family)
MYQGAGRGEVSTTSVTDKQSKGDISPSGWLAISVAIVPFFLKRAILLGQHDYIFWLTADYSARIISLIGVAMARRSGLFTPARPSAGILTSVLIFVALLAAEFHLHAIVYPVLRAHFNYFELWRFPSIPNPLVRNFDLTFGLLLVAVSEESVFRALLFSLFERWRLKPLSVIVLSSAAFALIHLTSGTAETLNAFLHGLLLGAAYWWTRRLVVCICAHYLFDLYIFSQSFQP